MEEAYLAERLVGAGVQVSLQLANSAIKVTGNLAQNIVLLMFGLSKHAIGKASGQTKNKGRVPLKILEEYGKTTPYTIRKEDRAKFIKALKRYSVKFDILNDLKDKDLIHFFFNEKDAAKVELAVNALELSYLEKTEIEVEPIKEQEISQIQDQEVSQEPKVTEEVKQNKDPKAIELESILKELKEDKSENFMQATQTVAQALEKNSKEGETKHQEKTSIISKQKERPSIRAKLTELKKERQHSSTKEKQSTKTIVDKNKDNMEINK